MKYTGVCTKCNSNEVIEIESNRFNTNNYVYLNSWGTKYALLDRFICIRCGFTEEYVRIDQKFKEAAAEIVKAKGYTKDEGFV